MTQRKFNIYDVHRAYAEKGVSGYIRICIETCSRTYIFHIYDEKLEHLLRQLKDLGVKEE